MTSPTITSGHVAIDGEARRRGAGARRIGRQRRDDEDAEREVESQPHAGRRDVHEQQQLARAGRQRHPDDPGVGARAWRRSRAWMLMPPRCPWRGRRASARRSHLAYAVRRTSRFNGGMRFVVLTGAGISAESGVPTFRDAGGLWEGHRVEDVATPEAFARDPDTVQRFYDLRRARRRRRRCPTPRTTRSPASSASSATTCSWSPRTSTTCTSAPAPQRVVHMHGELLQALCAGLRRAAPRRTADLVESTAVPSMRRADAAPRRRLVRRDAVRPRRASTTRSSPCDVFVAIGTSGAVYPAAGFVMTAAAAGAQHRRAQPRAERDHAALRRGAARPGERRRARVGRRGARRRLSARHRVRDAGEVLEAWPDRRRMRAAPRQGVGRVRYRP